MKRIFRGLGFVPDKMDEQFLKLFRKLSPSEQKQTEELIRKIQQKNSVKKPRQ